MRWLALALTLFATSAAAVEAPAPGSVRFATFNAALNEREAGGILRRLEGGADEQARLVAETIQRVRPDVLLLQELDRDPDGRSLEVFVREYLAVGQNGAEPIDYPHRVFPESNTGVPTGVDIDGDGEVGGPGDAKGYGWHEGQYAFALLSRLPLGEPRTYGHLLWRDWPLPGAAHLRLNALPDGHYSAEALAVLPLSSKTHLVVQVRADGGDIAILAAHPTPPVFDDESDFNGRRNADEIALLATLMRGLPASAELLPTPTGIGFTASSAASEQDEQRVPPAVVMGDLNADPNRGDARPGAIARLLDDPWIADPVPSSARGDITASFNDGMRVDYVLPTTALAVTGSGVFWPDDDDPLARLNEASDHRLVWVDLALP
jgi:endonuclease/exonuclease/phosphatase family metal-dependent hydrolase